MADPCVVGLDVGGSHSRAVLVGVDGRTLGTGRAGGGNPTVAGAGAAIANIVAALRDALGPVPAEQVEACVVGLAGVSTLMADPRAAQVLEQAWADAGLRCQVQVVSDVTVSFAAGTAAPDGALLVSGTGAVAARMQNRLPARFSDGYGWLLGDEGSGFWIGRQAARAAIAAADGRRPMAELAKAVLAQLLDQEPESHPAADDSPRATGQAFGLLPSTTPRANTSPNSPGTATIAPPGSVMSSAAGTAATARATAATPAGAAPKTAAENASTTVPAAAGTSTAATPVAAATAARTADTAAATGTSTVGTAAASTAAPADTSTAGTAAAATAAASTSAAAPTPTAPHPSPPVLPPATPAPPAAASIGEGFTLGGRRRAAELVRAVTAQPTVALAGLAPLVMTAYELGDPAAVRIVAEAAAALVESLAGVAPAPGEPVVLGGSVLVSRSPVFRAVAAAIGRRWPDSPIGLAADGAAGAGWLAARQLLGAERAAAGHAVFTGVPDRLAEFS